MNMSSVNYVYSRRWYAKVRRHVHLFVSVNTHSEIDVSGLIYRKHRPVHWSPSSVSALAEAELQYVDDHISQSAYITFRASSPENMSEGLRHVVSAHQDVSAIDFLVWTTTPWTIPANMVRYDIHFIKKKLN
jgi:isoleucyl-tRNA synthetase